MMSKKTHKIAEEKAFDYQRSLGMIDSVSDDHIVARRMGFYDGFVAGAQWQEKRDEETIKTAEDHSFLAGADWQKEQFEKNRLAHCDALSKEDYDRETDFAMEIIEKEHRQPTFSDAINYGMRLQKEQMLKGAVVGIVQPDDCEIWVNLVGYGYKFNEGDMVKLIIVKEDEK